MTNVLLVALNILLLVGGQVLWKIGIAHHPIKGIGGAFFALFTPYVFAGIVLYGLATVVWIYLLSKLPISMLYPVQSLAYVVTAVIAIAFFHEHVSLVRWAGIGVIMIGVALVVR